MKKVLLASTALVAFAGAAAADDNLQIAITGGAEMGVRGGSAQVDFTGGGDADADTPMQFHTDINVRFSMSGETDGGLTFGAQIDLDDGIGRSAGAGDADDTANDFDVNSSFVFLSGNFGTITMGDTDGAMDWALTEAGNMANPGSIDDSETIHGGYQGSYLDGTGDGQIVRYNHTIGQIGFAISIEQHDDIVGGGVVAEDEDDFNFALGVKYTFDLAAGSIDLGVGYQYAGDDTDTRNTVSFAPSINATNNAVQVAVGGTNAFGVSAVLNLDSGLTAGLVYTSFESDLDDNGSHLGLGIGYSWDAFSVHANYGRWNGVERNDTNDDASVTGFGLSAKYDLGGGAGIHFGYGSTSTDDLDLGGDGRADDYSASTYSLGLAFSF